MNTYRKLCMLGSLVVLVGGLTRTAWAQDVQPMPDSSVKNVPVWVQHLGEQLSQQLEGPVIPCRQDALQHLAYFSSFYGHALNLSPALPDLMRIYRESTDEQCRLLALVSIHAIGDERAMQALRQMAATETSPRVQLVTLAALMD